MPGNPSGQRRAGVGFSVEVKVLRRAARQSSKNSLTLTRCQGVSLPQTITHPGTGHGLSYRKMNPEEEWTMAKDQKKQEQKKQEPKKENTGKKKSELKDEELKGIVGGEGMSDGKI